MFEQYSNSQAEVTVFEVGVVVSDATAADKTKAILSLPNNS